MKSLLHVLFVLLLATSCKKQDEPLPADAITSDGTLIWYGSPSVDGCGLVLQVGSVQYFAGSEQNQYITFTEKDSSGIAVKAIYRITGTERHISWGCTALPIEVFSLKRQQ